MVTRFIWILAGLVVVIPMVAALATDWNSLGAPACCGPSFGTVSVQGCCELPPSCCRHVWDGYCETKMARGNLCPWGLRGPCLIGRRVCLPCTGGVPQECGAPLPVPDEGSSMSQLPAQETEAASSPAIIRFRTVTKAETQQPPRPLEPVIPLPPIEPEKKE